MQNLEWKTKAIRLVEAEPELPDGMPDALKKAIGIRGEEATTSVENLCRSIVRATKKNIIRRIKES
jgi:hypothetical protein